MKYSVTITDKSYWDIYQNEEMIESGIFAEDRFDVVVKAKNEDEAHSIANEMFLDGEFDPFTSKYCLSTKDCNWWENSMINSNSEWSKANDKYGDDLALDGGNTYYEIEEIKE